MNPTRNRVLLHSGLCALLSALMLVLAPAKALAVSFSEASRWENKWTVAPLGDGVVGYMKISFDDVDGKLVIRDLKSSNKRVATVEKDEHGLWIDYDYHIGSTTISCTVNGVKLSRVFRVKYTCPVKRFRVAGRNITAKFRKRNLIIENKTYKNKKVVIRAKAGWVITEVVNTTGYRSRTSKYKKGRKSVTVRITTVQPDDGLCVYFTNKKTGEEQEVDYLRGYKGTT